MVGSPTLDLGLVSQDYLSAMFLPDLEVVLIESNAKKATFLSEVIRELKVENVTVWRERVEKCWRKRDSLTLLPLGRLDITMNC